MWVAPSYIALLADRRGVPAPQADLPPADYRRTVYNANPDYLYLSTYHPRDTVRDVAWRTGMEAMAGHAEAIHSRKPGDGGAIGSTLLKIKRASRVGLLTVRGGTGDGHGTH
jgi:hypothetical protein